MPERLSSQVKGYSSLQFTLVDCPGLLLFEKKKKKISIDPFSPFFLLTSSGHASLIRTIIGGAQIIDFMILVIDVTKGIQTQTAEVHTHTIHKNIDINYTIIQTSI